MDLLEYYHQYPTNEQYVLRKTELTPHTHTNLYGVRGAGKTAMVLDFIKEEKKDHTLYIDLKDPKLFFEPLNQQKIQQYIESHQITTLVLDHYTSEELLHFPTLNQLIIISHIPIDMPHLIPLELFPLDYEEFLAFETSFSNSTTTFNHFLRNGTLPSMAQTHKSHQLMMKSFIQSHFDNNEQKLLLILAQHHTKHLTINQIYTFAKERFKISKDWLYKTIANWKKEKLLIFIENHYQKSGKKMLLFDFAVAKYLTMGQPFISQFDTMIALTLLKHNIAFKTLGIHGYIINNHKLIIPAPFESEDSLWVKSQNKFSLYKNYGIEHISIITVANTYTYTIEKLHFEALPFYEWSILHNEQEE